MSSQIPPQNVTSQVLLRRGSLGFAGRLYSFSPLTSVHEVYLYEGVICAYERSPDIPLVRVLVFMNPYEPYLFIREGRSWCERASQEVVRFAYEEASPHCANPNHDEVWQDIEALIGTPTEETLAPLFAKFPLCDEDFILNQVIPHLRSSYPSVFKEGLVSGEKPPQMYHRAFSKLSWVLYFEPLPTELQSPHWGSCKDLTLALMGWQRPTQYLPQDRGFRQNLERLSVFCGGWPRWALPDLFGEVSACPNLNHLSWDGPVTYFERAYCPSLESLTLSNPLSLGHLEVVLGLLDFLTLKNLNFCLECSWEHAGPLQERLQEISDTKNLSIQVSAYKGGAKVFAPNTPQKEGV